MSIKQLSINLTANSIAFFISVNITFLLTPFLVGNLGEEAFGFYPLYSNITPKVWK